MSSACLDEAGRQLEATVAAAGGQAFEKTGRPRARFGRAAMHADTGMDGWMDGWMDALHCTAHSGRRPAIRLNQTGQHRGGSRAGGTRWDTVPHRVLPRDAPDAA